MIHIVCNIDNNYVEYCGVMLNSLFDHNPNEEFAIHAICTNKVSATQKRRISTLCQKEGNTIVYYKVDYSEIKNFPIDSRDHLNLSAYLRLFTPNLLPESVNKVLYLDCDMMVIGSIKELWNIDISDSAVAAVEEREPHDYESPKRLNYSIEHSYFNSGVMLLNLEKLRDMDFVNQALSFIMTNQNNIIFHDQDVLNALLHKDKKFISIRWNVMDFFLYIKPEVQPSRIEDWKESLNSPAIVHFTGPRKPWKYSCDNPFRDTYINYARKNGWNVISYRDSIHYFFRKWLYVLINKRKTIRLKDLAKYTR